MFRLKAIVIRQRRNISQIANVQRKVRQTDRPANSAKYRQIYRQNSHDEYIDKVRPANTAENIDKVRTANISTKFARWRCRQSSPCKHDATIDNIQRKYRLSSPCKCNAIDNARQSDSVMVNVTLIAQSQNSKLFVVKLHLFYIQRLQTPKNLKG